MKFRIKEKTKLKIWIISGIILYSIAALILQRNERLGNNAYNGVLSALSFGICLFMVLKSYKSGWISSMILISISLLLMFRAFLMYDSKTTIPGMANHLFFMLILTLLMIQFRRREKESVTDFLTGLYNRRGLTKINKREDRE